MQVMETSDRILQSVIGRRVTSHWHNETGTVREWAPFGVGLCDAKIQRDDGSIVWVDLKSFLPIDQKGPLPTRADVCRARDAETLASLERIRAAALVEVKTTKWPGFDWAKVPMMKSIDGAIDETKRRLQRDTDEV